MQRYTVACTDRSHNRKAHEFQTKTLFSATHVTISIFLLFGLKMQFCAVGTEELKNDAVRGNSRNTSRCKRLEISHGRREAPLTEQLCHLQGRAGGCVSLHSDPGSVLSSICSPGAERGGRAWSHGGLQGGCTLRCSRRVPPAPHTLHTTRCCDTSSLLDFSYTCMPLPFVPM